MDRRTNFLETTRKGGLLAGLIGKNLEEHIRVKMKEWDTMVEEFRREMEAIDAAKARHKAEWEKLRKEQSEILREDSTSSAEEKPITQAETLIESGEAGCHNEEPCIPSLIPMSQKDENLDTERQMLPSLIPKQKRNRRKCTKSTVNSHKRDKCLHRTESGLAGLATQQTQELSKTSPKRKIQKAEDFRKRIKVEGEALPDSFNPLSSEELGVERNSTEAGIYVKQNSSVSVCVATHEEILISLNCLSQVGDGIENVTPQHSLQLDLAQENQTRERIPQLDLAQESPAREEKRDTEENSYDVGILEPFKKEPQDTQSIHVDSTTDSDSGTINMSANHKEENTSSDKMKAIPIINTAEAYRGSQLMDSVAEQARSSWYTQHSGPCLPFTSNDAGGVAQLFTYTSTRSDTNSQYLGNHRSSQSWTTSSSLTLSKTDSKCNSVGERLTRIKNYQGSKWTSCQERGKYKLDAHHKIMMFSKFPTKRRRLKDLIKIYGRRRKRMRNITATNSFKETLMALPLLIGQSPVIQWTITVSLQRRRSLLPTILQFPGWKIVKPPEDQAFLSNSTEIRHITRSKYLQDLSWEYGQEMALWTCKTTRCHKEYWKPRLVGSCGMEST